MFFTSPGAIDKEGDYIQMQVDGLDQINGASVWYGGADFTITIE